MPPFSFFQFWRKAEPKARIPISEIPIFSTLGPAELELIENKIRRVEYKKGDIVYRVGEKAEAFYIILVGRFRVISSKGDILVVLSQGDYFGESSILLGRDHSATVEAKNDSLVLRIDKKDFQDLLDDIPALSLHLSRTLGHRLTAGTTRTEVPRSKVVSICGYGVEIEKNAFALNLAAYLLSRYKKKTILIGFEPRGGSQFEAWSKEELLMAEFSGATTESFKKKICELEGGVHFLRIGQGSEPGEAGPEVASLLAFLMDRYDFVFVGLPQDLDEIAVKTLQQSDIIYFLVADAERAAPKALALLKEFRTSFGFSTDEIRLVLCEQKDQAAEATLMSSQNGAMLPIFSTLPYEGKLFERTVLGPAPMVVEKDEGPYVKAIRFHARELTGRLVGLALGSGAAFGFAHVGVLSILEQEQIPIDMIAGSSIGALIGAMWASGIHAKALEEIAHALDKKAAFLKLIGFQDFLFAHQGFFKGDQVVRFLRTYLKDRTFRSLEVPLKIVASNLFTGEEVVFDEGDVVEAVRASISIPGIFRPVRWHQEYLIDGGVVDPLPVKVLSRYGVKKIIAVNVLSATEDHIQRKEFNELKKNQKEEVLRKKNFLARAWFTFGREIEKQYQANIFNVLMNTIQFLEYGMAESTGSSADIVIHPVLTDAHWAEFYSAEKFIRCGEEKTREKLAEIKRLVEEGS